VSGCKYVLHLILAGIIQPGKRFISATGLCRSFQLRRELRFHRGQGINHTGRLFVVAGANLVLPYHKLIDATEERTRAPGRRHHDAAASVQPMSIKSLARVSEWSTCLRRTVCANVSTISVSSRPAIWKIG